MQNPNQHITKVEITQDKLVDILLHAATREDLANLAKETKSDFEKLEAKLDSRIDKLDSRIDKLDSRIDKLDAKMDRLTWFIIVGILVPIFLHFMK